MFRMYMKIIEKHHKDIRQSIRLHIIEDSGQVINKDVYVRITCNMHDIIL